MKQSDFSITTDFKYSVLRESQTAMFSYYYFLLQTFHGVIDFFFLRGETEKLWNLDLMQTYLTKLTDKENDEIF